MSFILALSPIILVLVGILGFKKKAKNVALVALLYTILLSFTYFNVNNLSFDQIVSNTDALVWKGIKEGSKIVLMLLGSFVMLEIVQKSGAMDVIKSAIANITKDRRAQLIIVGLMLPIFLEGSAGAGSPAAIAAPFLVGLGFDPIIAVVSALLGDATPCSWGGAGLTTISGSAALVDSGLSTISMNSAMVGRFHMFGVLIVPFIMTFLAFGKKGFKGIIPFLTFTGISTSITMFAFSNFIGPEVTSMGTGIVSILLAIVYLKIFKIKTPEEYISKVNFENKNKAFSTFRAFSPYLVLVLALPIVRYTVDMQILTKFGYIVCVDCVIFLSAIISAIILKVKYKEFLEILGKTFSKVIPVLITMGSLLIVAYIMQSKDTNMMNLIAETLSHAGWFYPAIAVLIGSLGAFITGTGLGSNIMFAPLHIGTSSTLGINAVTVFAGQNAGASLGNLICPNNVVAACATVNKIGEEGKVLKRALLAFGIILITYMILSLVYTHYLFADFHI